MNHLSKSMRQQWQEQGYLHLKNVIPKDEAAEYLDAANEVIAKYEAKYPQVLEKGVYTIIQTLFRTNRIDGLMDHPNLFGVILDLMGPYIQIMGSQIYVRYPNDKSDNLIGWHTDAGRSLAQIRVTPDSLPLNFKIQFFLTDIPHENCANFCLCPAAIAAQCPKRRAMKHRPVQYNSLPKREIARSSPIPCGTRLRQITQTSCDAASPSDMDKCGADLTITKNVPRKCYLA